MATDLKKRIVEIVEPTHTARGIPYQSVYREGEMLVKGERTDQLIRHALIRDGDLAGASVVDMGCNIGTSSFLAHESGAARVEGWDASEERVKAARELAQLLDYPVAFRVVDVADPPPGWCDTGLCFSLIRHANVLPALARCSVVYVETNVRDKGVLRPEVSEGWEVEFMGLVTSGRKMFRMTRGE